MQAKRGHSRQQTDVHVQQQHTGIQKTSTLSLARLDQVDESAGAGVGGFQRAEEDEEGDAGGCGGAGRKAVSKMQVLIEGRVGERCGMLEERRGTREGRDGRNAGKVWNVDEEQGFVRVKGMDRNLFDDLVLGKGGHGKRSGPVGRAKIAVG